MLLHSSTLCTYLFTHYTRYALAQENVLARSVADLWFIPASTLFLQYGLVIFFRGPRYVLVEGGALAKHTPEAHPEA